MNGIAAVNCKQDPVLLPQRGLFFYFCSEDTGGNSPGEAMLLSRQAGLAALRPADLVRYAA